MNFNIFQYLKLKTQAFAKSQKLSDRFINLLQTISNIFGILGTVAFSILHNKLQISLSLIGALGLSYQMIFICISFSSIWLQGSIFELMNHKLCIQDCLPINITLNETAKAQLTAIESFFFLSSCLKYSSIILLMTSITLSRFGFWLTDLVIYQIIQENVEEKKRGIIGGVQNSMNSIFELIIHVLVFIWSDASQYGYLVIVSSSAVSTSALLYIFYVIVETTNAKNCQMSLEQIDFDEKSIAEVAEKNHQCNKDAYSCKINSEIDVQLYKETSV